jgi:hypothetical protein
MSKPKSWRDVLPIHPAAEIFPLMKDTDPEASRALGNDIQTNGLREGVALIDGKLLDGRNRLDAMELVGMKVVVGGEIDWMNIPSRNVKGVDPYTFVFSKNMFRRHLSFEDKRKAIEARTKATPEVSDRQIATEANSNKNTVGRIRKNLVASGTCPDRDTRTDSKGRQQAAHKPPKPKPQPESGIPDLPGCLDGIDQRKIAAAEQLKQKEKLTADRDIATKSPAPQPTLATTIDQCTAGKLLAFNGAMAALLNLCTDNPETFLGSAYPSADISKIQKFLVEIVFAIDCKTGVVHGGVLLN